MRGLSPHFDYSSRSNLLEGRMTAGRLRGFAKGLALLMILVAALLLGQTRPADTEWRNWGGDAASTRYSPLDQINASNVNKLQIAWRWKTASVTSRIDSNWEVTPLMVGGDLYFTAGAERAAVAIEAT